MPTILKPKTYQELAAEKPKSTAYRVGDGNGLFLCILPSGKKKWQFDYTFNNKRTTYTFGNFE